MTFYYAPKRLFGLAPSGRGRKFQARDVEHAREKIQRLSNRTGKGYSLWYSKDYPRPNRKKKTRKAKRNPGTTVRGWIRSKAVKIVRNKKGEAVSVRIKT